MTTSVVLALFAATVALTGGRLRGARWPRRAPRLGIFAWQAMSLAVLAAAVLAGVAAAAHAALPTGADAPSLLGALALAVREPGAALWDAPGAVLAAASAPALLGRAGYCLMRSWWAVRGARARQGDALGLIGRRDLVAGALVVDDPHPAAYCVPGRGSAVVLTSAAVDVLDQPQQDAVLAHEQAHLRGRHDLAVTAARALHDAFPWVPLFTVAAAEISSLVEMHADDQAVRSADGVALATALVRLSRSPGSVDAATRPAAGAAAARVQRLLTSPDRMSRCHRWLIAAGIAVAVASPLLIAGAPAIETALFDSCPAPLLRCAPGDPEASGR